jgi:PAS domain S-box-containing protein
VYQAGVRSEARQGAILEAAQDAIITMDDRLSVSEFNPAAERMFGRSKTDVIGQSLEHLLPASTRETQLDAFRRYLATGAGPLVDRHLEIRAMRADGSEFPVEVTVARVGGGRHAALTGFFRDVTGRRALEEQLRQSQKLEAIGRLASGVAHDFNNVLMSVIGSAELILMQLGPDDPLRGEAEEIKEAVRRGTDLSGQLLALGRRQAKAPKLLALGDVVSGMRTMLRRLISADIDLQILCEPAKGLVMADPAQIEQVVLNLVINARDAMAGGGRLTVALTEVATEDPVELARVEGHAGRYVRLSVSDTGSGIDATTRARLFEPFFSTKEQGRGTGLGLSIVHGIVKQSGGFIAVDSEPGRGSTFFIYLPLAEEQKPAAALTSSRP